MQTTSIIIGSNSTVNITLIHNCQLSSTMASKMDISTFLNPSKELDGEGEAMNIDSAIPVRDRPKNSPQSGPSINSPNPSPLQSQVYSHRLPSHSLSMIQTQQPSPPQDQALHSNTLPPLRLLFQDISSRSITVSKGCDDYCSKMAMLEVQSKALLKCRPPLHHSCNTEGTVRTFHEYYSNSLVPDEDARRLARRRSHHSLTTSPQSHHRTFRRGSHPQFTWKVPIYRATSDGIRHRQPATVPQDQDAHYDSSSSAVSRPRKTTHNNKPYTVEMVDWIRYHKVDKNMQFKTDMMPLFFEQFPDRYDPDATEQILSSRYYRDNRRPLLDKDGKWYVDEKGLALTSDKVRDRSTAEGKELNVPAMLVERAPWRVVSGKYDHWKSPISEADKERAREILKGNDSNDPEGKRAEWRRIFRETEHLMYKDFK